jgi:hypothetical protein
MSKFTVSVIAEGEFLKATSDGTEEGTVFTGSAESIRLIKKNIGFGRSAVIMHDREGISVKTGYANPIALTAALFSISPLYTHVWRAPQEVYDFFGWKNTNDTGSIVEEIKD